MSLSYREQVELHRIESRLLRSDPHLAGMLAVFGRLSAGQRMPESDHAATRPDLRRQATALIARASAAATAATALLFSVVVALFTVLIVGRRVRPPQPTRQQTGAEPTVADD